MLCMLNKMQHIEKSFLVAVLEGDAGSSGGRMFADVIKIWSNLYKMHLCLVEIFFNQTYLKRELLNSHFHLKKHSSELIIS